MIFLASRFKESLTGFAKGSFAYMTRSIHPYLRTGGNHEIKKLEYCDPEKREKLRPEIRNLLVAILLGSTLLFILSIDYVASRSPLLQFFNELELFRSAAITLFSAAILFYFFEKSLTNHLLQRFYQQFQETLVRPQYAFKHYSDSQIEYIMQMLLAWRIDKSHLNAAYENKAKGISNILDKHRSSIAKPKYFYKNYIDLYDYNDEYFRIEKTITYWGEPPERPIKIACVHTLSHANEEHLYDSEHDYTWVFLPPNRDRSLAEAEFRVLGQWVRPNAPVGDQLGKYIPEPVTKCDEEGNRYVVYTIDKHPGAVGNEVDGLYCYYFKISVLQAKEFGLYASIISGMTQHAEIKVNYSRLGSNNLWYIPYFTSENPPRPTKIPNDTSQEWVIEVVGWIMKGSGVMFSWTWR